VRRQWSKLGGEALAKSEELQSLVRAHRSLATDLVNGTAVLEAVLTRSKQRKIGATNSSAESKTTGKPSYHIVSYIGPGWFLLPPDPQTWIPLSGDQYRKLAAMFDAP
jgi:hypothetical protein